MNVIEIFHRIPLLDGEEINTVGRFNYLGSCVTKNDSTIAEMSTCLSKAQAMGVGLKHSWH